MKKALLFLVLVVVAVVAFLIWDRVSSSQKAAALSPDNAIVRIHFAGAENLAADTNSVAFTNIFCCSQAHALIGQTLDKLSRAPGEWFKDKLPAGAGDGSAQLRPLLDDLVRSEWVFQMQDAPSSPEYALAVQLNDSRARLWETNLRAMLESWTGIKAQDITGGWELKKDMAPNLVRVVRAGNWLILGCGQDELPLSDAWVSGTQVPDTNETNWVSAKLNWPRLSQIFPIFAKFDLPAVQMQVVGRGGKLLPSGTIELSQPLPALDPWQIPTDLLNGPFTSFTAIRGFRPWLERQPWAKPLEISPEPDQAFIWSVGQSSAGPAGQFPNQTYIAAPVSNSVTALAQLGKNLSDDTNWEKHMIYVVPLVRTNNRIALENLPFFVAPEVRAVSVPSGDYLLADFFPDLPGSPPPEALLQAINRDNLVVYHWEITPKRLKDLPHLTQLALLMTQHRQLDQNSAADRWLTHIGPTLGDSVTEVTQTGPSELSFTRSARAGLTAIELIALAEWLEAPNFPGCDMTVPPPPVIPHHPHKKGQRLPIGYQPMISPHPPQQLKTSNFPSSSSNTVSPIPKKP